MPRRLSLKLILSLTVIVIVVSGLFSLHHIRRQRQHLLDTMILGADQLSRSITSATWHAMLADHRTDAYDIMRLIGQERGNTVHHHTALAVRSEPGAGRSGERGTVSRLGPVALVSIARLRPEFYGLPPDGEVLASRLRKEVLHETGHAFGLVHCSDPGCAMSLSTALQHVDAKEDAYCSSCRRMIGRALERFREEGR